MSDESQYTRDVLAAEEAVKPLISDELLTILVALARVYGWSGDLGEVMSFIGWMHELRGSEADYDLMGALSYGEPAFAAELAELERLVRGSGK